MPRPSSAVAAPSRGFLLLAAALAAPLPSQMFEVYPSRPDTSWSKSTRLGLGANTGEILMHVPGSHFRSVGDRGMGSCQCWVMYRFEVRFWDGDRSTAETFTPIIRDWTGTQPGARLNWFTPPSSPPTGLPGPGLVTTTLFALNGFPLIPCTAGFCIGVEVGPATYSGGVLIDGLEVLAADYRPGGAPVPATGDYPRNGPPSYAWWKCNGGCPWVQHQASPGLTLAFAVDPATPVLNVGNHAPKMGGGLITSFGVGGMHPDNKAPRLDGLDVRVQDLGRPFGMAFVFVGWNPTSGISVFPFAAGCVQLFPEPLYPLQLDGAGFVHGTLLPAGMTANANLSGKIWVQALVADAGMTSFHLSNAQAVDF